MMSDALHRERYLMVAARLQGLIEAHRLLKGEDGDVYDENLWRVTEQTLRKAYSDE
jgi:hypothetical protein